jgi:hypothetical protein
MKKILSVSLIVLLLLSLFAGDFNKDSEAALNWGKDWVSHSNTPQRTRFVSDSEMKPPIVFKAKLNLGWSTSQPIAVGDFIYHIASVPDTNNLFQLPAGTYFYRIPADFRFFRPTDSQATIRAELIAKGAAAIKLDNSGENYGSPTWSPSNNGFWLGVKKRIIFVSANFSTVRAFTTDAQLVGSPLVLDNDLFVMGTGSGAGQAGGDLIVVKGLKSGYVTGRAYPLSTASNAEVTGTLSQIPNTNSFGIGVNFRDSGAKGPFKVFRAIDNGLGELPALASPWSEPFYADTGLPTTPVYDGGYFYMSDKYGTAYKLNASNGDLIWKTDMSASIGSITLVNNSPAVDSNYVYFPIRRPGKIAAVRKSNGSVAWYAYAAKDRYGNKLDNNLTTGEDVANDITAWRTADGQNLVFYGDTDGQLSFLTSNGTRSNVAIDYSNYTLTRSSINATTNSDVPSDWQVQGQGLATEVMLAKKHLVFGVNTSSNRGELWFYSIGVADDVYVASIEGGKYRLGQYVLTKVRVGNKDFGTGKRVPMVRFYRDGVLLEQRRVDLKLGEEKDIYFMWKADKKVSNGQLYVTINYNPSEFSEIDYSNNFKSANYSVDEGTDTDLCLPTENNNRAIVKIETHTDSEGNTYTVYYYEYLYVVINDAKPKKLRAGYGFTFETITVYIDESETYSGPKRVRSKFPAPVNYVPDTVYMEKGTVSGPSYSETAIWRLPLIYVEKYSGNVFYDKNDVHRDIEDTIVVPSGERKWYTDFKTKDGLYLFKSVAEQAGKNNLSACYTYDQVEVKGTPFDDYVRRSVLPNTPFLDDDKVGFNWQGKESILEDVVGFYYNPSANSGHYSTYFLKPEVIKEIKETDSETLSKEKTNNFFNEHNFEE